MSVWPSTGRRRNVRTRNRREGESRPPTQARLGGRQRLRDPGRLHEQVIVVLSGCRLLRPSSGGKEATLLLGINADLRVPHQRPDAVQHVLARDTRILRPCGRQDFVTTRLTSGRYEPLDATLDRGGLRCGTVGLRLPLLHLLALQCCTSANVRSSGLCGRLERGGTLLQLLGQIFTGGTCP
jgi:hypothetical protein